MNLFYFWLACLLSAAAFLSTTASAEYDPQDVENLSERHLRWQGQIIKPDRSSLPDIPINYFIPHPNSARAVETASFTGFTVYQRNGNPNVPPDAGYFAFVSTADAQRGVAQGNCIPTMHAGAYYHIFKRCPEDENRIVASGHCRVNGELRFNSGTFNQPVGRDYLYEEYYLNNDRPMNPTEQNYFAPCIQKWADAGFPLAGWRCEIQAPFTPTYVKRRHMSKRAGTCDPCGAVCDKGAAENEIWRPDAGFGGGKYPSKFGKHY